MVLERNVPLELSTVSDLEISDTALEIESYFQKEGFVTLLKRFEKGSGAVMPRDEKEKREAAKPPGGDVLEPVMIKVGRAIIGCAQTTDVRGWYT